MKDLTEIKLTLYFTIAYLAIFTALAILKGNYEFVYYIFIMASLLVLTVYYYKKIHLTLLMLTGLSLLGIMHVMGGVVSIGATQLYYVYLIPGIFRYDNLVHSFGVFLATFAIYGLVRPYLLKKTEHNSFVFCFILVSSAMGVGAFNEIIELIAVLFFNAQQGVGEYLNNAFDLVFNLFGTLVACFVIMKYHLRSNGNT